MNHGKASSGRLHGEGIGRAEMDWTAIALDVAEDAGLKPESVTKA